MKTKTVPLNIVIDEAFSDLELDAQERNMATIRRQATDIYREFATTEQLIHKIVLLETDRHGKIEIPGDFKKIDQIAYRLKKRKDDCTPREQVVEWVQNVYNCAGEDFEVKIDVRADACTSQSCASLPIEVDVDFAWQKSNPWYYSQSKMAVPKDITHELNRDKSYLSNKFTLMAYKGNSYFRLQYHMDDNCENLHCLGCKYAYSLEYPYILTDLPKDTEVLLSYFAEVTDEDGNILIPDDPDALEAIKEGILAKYFRLKFLESGEKNFEYFYKDSENKSTQAIGRAKSKLGSPINQELRTFLSNVWMRRVRNTSSVGTVMPKDPYNNYLK